MKKKESKTIIIKIPKQNSQNMQIEKGKEKDPPSPENGYLFRPELTGGGGGDR
jgi:hypothetical protein